MLSRLLWLSISLNPTVVQVQIPILQIYTCTHIMKLVVEWPRRKQLNCHWRIFSQLMNETFRMESQRVIIIFSFISWWIWTVSLCSPSAIFGFDVMGPYWWSRPESCALVFGVLAIVFLSCSLYPRFQSSFQYVSIDLGWPRWMLFLPSWWCWPSSVN